MRCVDGVDLDATQADKYDSFSATAAHRDSDANLDSMNCIDVGGSWDYRREVHAASGYQQHPGRLFASGRPVATARRAIATANNFPQVYDSIARYMFMGLTIDF